jgi:hypothetical protein
MTGLIFLLGYHLSLWKAFSAWKMCEFNFLSLLICLSFLTYISNNTFNIPEIIYDPTLVLSPHVFLLGMLFKAHAFKSPSIISLEKLYSPNILNRLNEQRLLLLDKMNNDFIFCQAVREAQGFRIVHELQLTLDWI